LRCSIYHTVGIQRIVIRLEIEGRIVRMREWMAINLTKLVAEKLQAPLLTRVAIWTFQRIHNFDRVVSIENIEPGFHTDRHINSHAAIRGSNSSRGDLSVDFQLERHTRDAAICIGPGRTRESLEEDLDEEEEEEEEPGVIEETPEPEPMPVMEPAPAAPQGGGGSPPRKKAAAKKAKKKPAKKAARKPKKKAAKKKASKKKAAKKPARKAAKKKGARKKGGRRR